MDEADCSRGRFTQPPTFTLRRIWPHVLLFLIFAFVLVPPTNATIVVPLSEDALIEDAVAIVLGHVTAIQGNYDQTHGLIFTNVTLTIEEVLKGEIPVSQITLRQPGGSIGNLHSWVVGSPQFTLGEKVLLFLRLDRDGNLRVAHLYQGKFTVSRDLASGEEFAAREIPPGVHARHGFPAGSSSGPGEKETHRLRDFTDRIRHHLSEIPSRPSQYPAALTLTPGGTPGTTVGALQENFTFMGPARWFEPDSGLPVSMKINPSGEPLAPTNGFDQIRQALQAWSNVEGSSFRYQDGGFTEAAGFRSDGVNAVSFRDPDGILDPPVGCMGTYAVGGFHYTPWETRVVNGTTFWRIDDGDLVVNDGLAGCGFYESFANLAEAATHELGHVLGLDHSSDPSATMYYVGHFDGRGAALRQDDIDGLIAIYPGVTVTLVTDKSTPQQVGTTITFTATASDGIPPYQYKWWLTTDNWQTWSLLRDWGENTYAWTPTVPASYQVGVWARSSGTTADAPQATRGLAFTITAPLPPTITGLTASLASPQVVGTPITLTATVTGGVTPQQCKWWLTTDNWAHYSAYTDWQPCTTPVPWTPTVPASYQVGVWARSSGTTADAPQATRGLAYEIEANVAGNWNYTESGTITYTYTYAGMTETETEPVGGSGVVTVVQNLKNVSWTSPGTSYGRSGTITGNYVQVTGIACAAIAGADVIFTQNVYTAQGAVSADGRTLNLTGSGSCQGTGTVGGIPFNFRGSGSSTVVMTR